MATETIVPIQEKNPPILQRTLRKCFSFPVFLGAILVGANFTVERGLRLDPDTWWHMKYGDMILQTRRWPTVDTWSFTVHGMPRVAYEWGGEALTALAYRLGGLRGLDVLLITLTSTIVILLYYFAWLRCRNSKAAFAGTLLILPVALVGFTLRPQLIGYIFLLITLISLERFRQGEQMTLWVLPPIFLLWVNTHGSFTLGFMVLGLYWLGGLKNFSSGELTSIRWQPAQRIHMELVCLLSLLVLPLTPYGTRLAAVPVEVGTSLPLNFADIVEWQPLNANYWEARLLLVLLFAFIATQIAFHFPFRFEEFGLFLLAAYLTFVHFRFAILYAIIFAPLAASILSRWAPGYHPKIDKYALNAILIIATLVTFAWYLPSKATLEKHISEEYPVQAVSYLQDHAVPGRMFNEYFFGGYLVWTLAPKPRVFIDGRGDIFERAGVFSDYMDVINLKPNALAVLQTYRIDSCLLYQNSPLATLLAASPDWRRIYRDKLSAVFVRKATESYSRKAVPKSGIDAEAEQKEKVNTRI